MKVKTKDFQILRGEQEFEFPVGITIIQGKNACGKSTLFYAIEDCLTNPSGVADCINHDAKSCSVEIENNGAHVKWIKTPSSSEYTNVKTGETFVKASKLDSRDIGDLGFYFDTKGNILNIHNEWSVLFPFGQSDAEMFRMFEDIFNISCSFQIIDEIKKDAQNKKAEQTAILTQINEGTKQLNNIEDVLSKIDKNQVQYIIEQLNSKENLLKQIKEDFDHFSKNQLTKNLQIPQEFNTDTLIDQHSYCKQIKDDYNNYVSKQNLLNIKLPEYKEFNIVEPSIRKDYEVYKKLKQDIEKYTQEELQIEKELQEVQEKLNEIKVCPTCGQQIKGNK